MSKLPVAAFAALVAATVGAFFVTQHLKVTTPLIAGAPAPKPAVINPIAGRTCGPPLDRVDHSRTYVTFYLLHRPDTVAVYIVDPAGTIVRTVSAGYHMGILKRNPPGQFVWDGHEDNGSVAPDGTYYYRIALLHQGRTIQLTGKPVTVKTQRPEPVVHNVSPSLISPPGAPVTIRYSGNDGLGGRINVYRTDVAGKPPIVKSFMIRRLGKTAAWDGLINRRPAPAGVYLIGMRVVDAACNIGSFPKTNPAVPGSTPHAGTTVRYVAAEPPLTAVPAGTSATVFVDSRRKPYRWALRAAGGAKKVVAHGAGRSVTLHVHLPAAVPGVQGSSGAGLYELAVRSGPYRTVVPVIAGAHHAPRRASVLVVLPALTWQGQNPVDDNGDGQPNLLDTGGPVALQRPLSNGLPTGFGDEAAFLAQLYRQHLSFDLGSDLSLLRDPAAALGGHHGVVLAGSERWLPAVVSTALRSYVQGGGHVFSLGLDSLRRGVTVAGGQAFKPTPPFAQDAFGARPGALAVRNSELVTVFKDDLRIFIGTSGAFPGVRSFQAIRPAASEAVSIAGTSPATPSIIGFGLGHGDVVEVGVVGFGSQLAHNVDFQEFLTRVWGLLSVTRYLKRLVSSLAAYQVADIVSKFMAVLLLPVYTRHVSPRGYGTVETLATSVIFVSIVVRFGMIEAFLRYHFVDEDPARRDALARRAVGFLLLTTTLVSIPLLFLAAPLSKVLLGHRDVTAFRIAVLGLWSFTNLELAYGLLRVEERLRAYATASLINVALTIIVSLILVVGYDKGANGLLLGNYGASTVVLFGVWFSMRRRLLVARAPAERFSTLLRFGLPTVPAEASVYALSVVDRIYIAHQRGLRQVGLYSIAVKFAGAIAFVVRAFQYAWPPLAYSVKDDAEASRLYGLITTYYVLVTGYAVVGIALFGRWILRLLTTPAYYGAYPAVIWVSLGWALYGLWVVFLVIAGRAKVTTRNFVASLVGLGVNIVMLVALVPPLGIVGAGLALCGAYVAMLGLMYFLTRSLFAVQFEWMRLAQLVLVFGSFAAAGELLLPRSGALGLVTRAAVFLAIGPVLYLIGFAHEPELRQAKALIRRVRPGSSP